MKKLLKQILFYSFRGMTFLMLLALIFRVVYQIIIPTFSVHAITVYKLNEKSPIINLAAFWLLPSLFLIGLCLFFSIKLLLKVDKLICDKGAIN